MKINDEVVYRSERWFIIDIYGDMCTIKQSNSGNEVTVNLTNVYKYVPIGNFDVTPFKTLSFYYEGSGYNNRNFIDTSDLGYASLLIGGRTIKVYLNDPGLEIPDQTFRKNDTVIVNYLQSSSIDSRGKLTSMRSKNIGNMSIPQDFRKDAKLYMHRTIGKVVKTFGNTILIKFPDGEELYYNSMMIKLIKAQAVKVKTFNPTDKYLHIKSGKVVQIIENMLVTSISFAKVKVVDSDEHMNIKIRDLKLIK